MQTLTPRQQQVLNAIRRAIDATGRPPTQWELAKILGLKAQSAVTFHLRALEKRGAIRLLGGSRGIELIDAESLPGQGLPLLGQVPAGLPLEAIEHLEASLDVRTLFPRADYFLRVQGDSMIEAGIFDGDLIAVQRTEEAKHGDIIVARLRDEDTVKRFYCRDGAVRLVPEHPSMPAIIVGPEDGFAIDGVVIGSVRPSLK